MTKKSVHQLRRVKLIVDLYKKHKRLGYSDAFVYREYINPVYPMSLSTFYEYLSVPVDRMLKENEVNK